MKNKFTIVSKRNDVEGSHPNSQGRQHRREQVEITCLRTTDGILLEQGQSAGTCAEQVKPLHHYKIKEVCQDVRKHRRKFENELTNRLSLGGKFRHQVRVHIVTAIFQPKCREWNAITLEAKVESPT